MESTNKLKSKIARQKITIMIIVFFTILSIKTVAQTRITDYCLSEMKEVFPKKMENTTIWIDSTFSKLFISNFNYSESYKHDNNFYSFNLASRISKKITLYNLNGITLNPNFSKKGSRFLMSEIIMAELSDEKNAYSKTFNYDNFKYTNKEYFDLALKFVNIEDPELLAHTLNYFVELEEDKKNVKSENDKFKQFINDVNKKNKLKLLYNVKENSIYGLRDFLRKNGINSISSLVYKTYVLGKNEAKTIHNINSFFSIVGFYGSDVFSTIDRILTEKLKIKFNTTEDLEFPTAIIKSVTSDAFLFSIENIEATFDCKKSETEILLIGKSNGACLVKQAVKKYSTFGKKYSKDVLDYQIESFNRIRIIIDEKKIYLTIYNENSNEEYSLIENKFNN